jgi:hypothetical protein
LVHGDAGAVDDSGPRLKMWPCRLDQKEHTKDVGLEGAA